MYSKGADSFFMKNLSAKSDSLKRKAKDSLRTYSKQVKNLYEEDILILNLQIETSFRVCARCVLG